MSWLKLSDDFPTHPKIMLLDDAAFRLHVMALCYCARNGTEGFVSGKVAPRLRLDADQLIPQLIDARLWEPCEGGWNIHDYLTYNLSNERIEEIRAERAKAGRAGYQAGSQRGYGPGRRPAAPVQQNTAKPEALQQPVQQVAEPLQQTSANPSPRIPYPVNPLTRTPSPITTGVSRNTGSLEKNQPEKAPTSEVISAEKTTVHGGGNGSEPIEPAALTCRRCSRPATPDNPLVPGQNLPGPYHRDRGYCDRFIGL